MEQLQAGASFYSKQIAVQPHDLAAQRTVSIEKYIQEAMEFADHLLKPAGLRESESVVLKKFSEILSETIRAHPRCLSHFDYGTQNITVAKNGSIHLVDFQDACVVSRARDPYSLLNDRDIDQHLGESLQERLLQRFMSGYGWTTPERDSFVREYQEYGTHWDMRVSGRFALLQSQVGKERYGQWIPGTLRRLGRRLPKLVAQFPGLDDVIEISQRLLPEFREGVRSV
jgi:aminoglycoside/choline kinase family phosphotransferase